MTSDGWPAPPPDDAPLLLRERFTATTVTRVRHTLTSTLTLAGLSGERAEDFVLAVNELVTNAVLHGGGTGRLELSRREEVLTCEIIDQGRSADGLPVRLPGTKQTGGRGLWLAHQLTGSLLLTRRADGVTASVSVCVTEPLARKSDKPAPSRTEIGTHDATAAEDT